MPIVYSGKSFDEDEDQGFFSATGSKVLDTLSLLERPAQALKVGIKEAATEDGEGFASGFVKGLTGKDEVRTQDFLSEDFVNQHPFFSGVIGFTGDVLTDPLTFAGGAVAGGLAKGISATAKATPGYGKVASAAKKLSDTDAVKNMSIALNVPYGRARQVLGFGRKANDMLFSFGSKIESAIDDYVEFASKRVKETEKSKEDIDSAFRNYIEKFGGRTDDTYYKTLPDSERYAWSIEHKQIMDDLGEEGRALANAHQEIYKELKAAERAVGVRTASAGSQGELFTDLQEALPRIPGEESYLPHIATPQVRQNPNTVDQFVTSSPLEQGGFTKQRGLEGTIDEVNSLYSQQYGYNAFHTDPAIMMGVRYSRSAAKQSQAWFRNEVKRFGETSQIIKRPYVWKQRDNGTRYKHYLDESNPDDAIKIELGAYDNVEYYTKKPEGAGKKGFYHLADKVMIKDLDGTARWYPKDVAKQIKEREDFILGKAGTNNKFLKFYDDVQNGWKKWSLGIRPAYHTRNAIGNIFNAYVIGGTKNPLMYSAAGKLQSKVLRGQELDKTGDFMGTGMSESELWFHMNDNGVVSKQQYGIDVLQETEKEIEKLAGYKQTVGDRAKQLYADNPLVEAGFKVGSTIEQNARIAVFIDKLRKARMDTSLKYYDPKTGRKIKVSETRNKDFEPDIISGAINYANQEVKKALFDYSDLSAFERNVMKRFVPFYTWSRKNIPAQLESLVLNPQRLEQLDIARDQFEYRGGRPDEQDIGPFWRGRVPIFLGGESDRVRQVFSLLNFAPIADLERLGDPKALLQDMVSPLIKEPIEQIINYDTFRQQPIKEYVGQTKDFLGVSLPPRLAKLANILVPLADLNRLNPMGVFGEQVVDPVTGEQTVTRAFGGLGASRESGSIDIPGTSRMIRFFLGVQAYDVDLSKNEYWRNKNFVKDLQALKSKLKWAAYKGENRRVEELQALIDEVIAGDVRDPLYLGR